MWLERAGAVGPWHDGPVTSTQPVDYIALTRAQYDALGYQAYQWAERPDRPAWTPMPTLASASVVLIGSGGAYREGQVAYHWKDDTGIRHLSLIHI